MWARLAGTWGRGRGGVKAGVRHEGAGRELLVVEGGARARAWLECLEEIWEARWDQGEGHGDVPGSRRGSKGGAKARELVESLWWNCGRGQCKSA